MIYRSTRRDKRVWATSNADGAQRAADTGKLDVQSHEVIRTLAGALPG